MIRRLLFLIGSSIAIWAVVALVARAIWGDVALVFSGVALLVCLAPASLSLVWADWAYRQSPDQQFTMLLGATGLRMFVVLIVAFVLHASVPYLQQSEALGFWMWVLAFYFITLALETTLSLAGRPAVNASRPATGSPSVNQLGQ